ncbi:NAD(P)H-dependent oxidoreductase [Facklamia languida]|uniref:Flavodoxin-like fold domain-containing protein n=1 Tax=Facklamia languida CCUG 37842 TaxID=883113 RepID=H3NIX4_9LACT|nr:NAD(P)H-dependent oxidoreductase [Facklamia languida]EHR37252.1 hypothetical protein HMPREF9708_00813 [Facklamia languida CCUG 37842]
MKTIIYLAHDDLASSSSQQFLVASGRHLTEATYVDLGAQWQADPTFDRSEELDRLAQYDRVIFQFPLYWYQAPAVLKVWIDQVLDQGTGLGFIAGKELGLVVIAGAPARNYQLAGREGVTVSDLLSPYYALSRYLGMRFLEPFTIFQFAYLSEAEKMRLMYDYALYLKTGEARRFNDLQDMIIQALQDLDLNLSPVDQVVFDQFVMALEDQAQSLKDYQAVDQWEEDRNV